MRNIRKIFLGVLSLVTCVSAFAQNLNGSWYEYTLHERSRFRSYFYRINDTQISVVDKKNGKAETFFDYKIKDGFIEIKSTGKSSPKISSGKFPITIKDDNYFTIEFNGTKPMSFVRNTFAKEQAVGAMKTAAIVSAAGFATAVVGAVGEKAIIASGALAGSANASEYKKFTSNMVNPSGLLQPNLKYTSCGYNYESDKIGRISRFAGKLRLEEGVRNQTAQRIAGGGDRLGTDQGGHLIADRFGGSGNLENLVAMNGRVNTSNYKKLENIWAKALEAGKQVEIDGKIFYEGPSQRPSKFVIEYWIDGVKQIATIFNPTT